METTIIVNGKLWIIPGDKVGALISWLSANAVDSGSRKQEVREVRTEGTDPRQLIVE